MSQRTDYFNLTEHNSTQKLIYTFFIAFGIIISFTLLIPAIEYSFTELLNGDVYKNGEEIAYHLDDNNKKEITKAFTNWAVDIYKNTPQEMRYWINPIIILLIPCLSLGMVFAFLLSSVLPYRIGFIKQKIEREIIGQLDSICLKVHGFHGNQERIEIENLLLKADLRDIHDYVIQWKLSLEDLLIMNRAIKWLRAKGIKKLFQLPNALKFYMRLYITIKYSNLILGSVYFGAAVLIIIIGLRGIKFIPANEPSLVFFALGLEFALLVLYAFTLMFGKEDNESSHGNEYTEKKSIFLSDDFGSQKEVESLLKMFIKKNENS